VLRILT